MTKCKTTATLTNYSFVTLLLFLLLLAPGMGWGQCNCGGTAATYSTKLTGDWTSSGTWVSSSVPSTTLPNNKTVSICSGHTVTVYGDLTIDNNTSTLCVTGTLIIKGNLTLKNGAINVYGGGNLIVTGNLNGQTGSLNIDNASGGDVLVGGSFTYPNTGTPGYPSGTGDYYALGGDNISVNPSNLYTTVDDLLAHDPDLYDTYFDAICTSSPPSPSISSDKSSPICGGVPVTFTALNHGTFSDNDEYTFYVINGTAISKVKGPSVGSGVNILYMPSLTNNDKISVTIKNTAGCIKHATTAMFSVGASPGTAMVMGPSVVILNQKTTHTFTGAAVGCSYRWELLDSDGTKIREGGNTSTAENDWDILQLLLKTGLPLRTSYELRVWTVSPSCGDGPLTTFPITLGVGTPAKPVVTSATPICSSPNTVTYQTTEVEDAISYDWQVSYNDGSSWTFIGNTTAPSIGVALNSGAAIVQARANVTTTIFFFGIPISRSFQSDWSTASNPILVAQTPSVTLIADPADNPICAGTPVTFTAGGGGTYQFTLNESNIAGATESIYIANNLINNDKIGVVVTKNGCSASASLQYAVVSINPGAILSDKDNPYCYKQGDVVNLNSSANATADPFGTITYSWEILTDKSAPAYSVIGGESSSSYKVSTMDAGAMKYLLMQIRRRATSGSCSSVTSDITINRTPVTGPPYHVSNSVAK